MMYHRIPRTITLADGRREPPLTADRTCLNANAHKETTMHFYDDDEITAPIGGGPLGPDPEPITNPNE